MLVDQSVSTLINGVSQQAENLRFSSQCTEQINALPSVLTGLTKRPPTRHKKVLTLPNAPFASYAINRSETEQYQLIVGNQLLKITDLSGNEIPVKNAQGDAISSADLAYLTATKPVESLKPLTVADYTILLNREKATALDPSVTDTPIPSALIFVKQLRRGADYRIKVYDTPDLDEPSRIFTVLNIETNIDSTTSTDPKCADQTDVINHLSSRIEQSGSTEIYDYLCSDALMLLSKKDGSDFRVEVECSIPEGMTAVKEGIQNFALLPKKAVKDYLVRIIGDPDTDGDEFYVKYVTKSPTAGLFAEGSWEECQAPGLRDNLDPATMPHALVNMGTHFVFKPLEWGARTCGDADTNPPASFVGRKINDVFFVKNRLGFLSGENEILSESGEFFNFWRTTVTQLLDSDPIDVGAGHTKVSTLNSAVVSNEQLLLFSAQAQFAAGSDGLLTPKSASILPISDCENIPSVPPKAIGNSVLFAFKRGSSSGMADYGIAPDTGKFVPSDVTEHVPNYLRGTVTAFEVCDVENTVVVKTDAFSDTLFVYRFFKRGYDRLQSAWGKWTFGGTIRSFFILGSRLYMIVQREGTNYFETIDLNSGVVDEHSTFTAALDRRLDDTSVTKSYNAVNQRTTFTLPYAPNPTKAAILTRAAADDAGYSVVRIKAINGANLTVEGDLRNQPLWFGENYDMVYTMSRPQLRERRTNGEFVVVPGRFQVRYGLLAFDNSLAFRIEVTPTGRNTYHYEYAPRALNTTTSVVGTLATPQTGVKRFPVFSKNDQVTIKIINDTPMPCSLLSVDWEALYTARSQRV